jgi:hypothetical protein
VAAWAFAETNTAAAAMVASSSFFMVVSSVLEQLVISARLCPLVALPRPRDLLLSAKHLFGAAMLTKIGERQLSNSLR